MELVWLIVQASVLCAALLAVTCGLMFAPWYVLLVALGLVLATIHKLMPELTKEGLEPTVPVSQANSPIARANFPIEPTQTSSERSLATPHSTHLIYRGIDYIVSHDREGHPV
ncbi:hypothetical protein [Leptodesmis sichuanensis]|uniref:hypothetical protein n=1 Tax=Leptodesmis sichuanensis TaxID=2906798 RepID=UPI001F4331F2|nr:hypothetical protein [Leptodesmis sichuanensis]UIE37285.1 hypothetical protein KIK02_20375 [Leptodesmis sichuanensis A121]